MSKGRYFREWEQCRGVLIGETLLTGAKLESAESAKEGPKLARCWKAAGGQGRDCEVRTEGLEEKFRAVIEGVTP